MKDSDGKILKALLLTVAEYAGAVIASTGIFFGLLYIISWMAELLASKLPFWVLWTLFFIVMFGLFFGTLASSPGNIEKSAET